MPIERIELPGRAPILLFDAYTFGVYGTTVLADSTSSGNMAVANLLNGAMDRPYRSGSLIAHPSESIMVAFSFSTPRLADAVAICRSNCLLPIRASFYATAGEATTLIWQSAWHEPIVRADLDDYDYYDFDWLMGPSGEQVDRMQTDKLLITPIFADQTYGNIRYLQLEFAITVPGISGTGPVNNGVDYIQFSVVLFGKKWQVSGEEFGADQASIGPKYLTEVIEGKAGGRYGRKTITPRVLQLNFPIISRRNALAQLLSQWQIANGQLSPVLAIKDPTTPARFYDQSFAGTLTDGFEINERGQELDCSASFSITETF